MQRVRVISVSGRKPLGPRPASPNRFANVPPLLLSPLRSSDGLNRSNSPVSRPASPCLGDVSRPASPLSPVGPRSPSPCLKQCNTSRTKRTSLLAPQNSIPKDTSDQPPDLTGQIMQKGVFYTDFGGFGDVWIGSWPRGAEVCTVAVKVLRPRGNQNAMLRLNKRLRREVKIWKRLVHTNIVPLLGTTNDFGPCTGMVSPWMDYGNLSTFLEKMASALSISDRFQILCDVAAGLAYLHSESVVHGDLTGPNVLIDGNRKARLIDFGLSSVKAEFEGTSYWSSTIGGALRWRAPELLPKDDCVPALRSTCDIYSFGNIMLQTISGKVPYHNIKSELCVLIELLQGIRPRRPSVPMLTDSYWMFIGRCWNDTPSSRPHIDQIHDCLLEFHRRAFATHID